MSYQDVSNLARDPGFGSRLAAGLAKEAVAKPSDYLVDQILKNPEVGSAWFMPFVSTAPGFDNQWATGGQLSIDDGEILAAIQANWQRVFDLYAPPA